LAGKKPGSKISQEKTHIIAEFSISPIGSSSTSVGRQVGAALRALRNVKGIRYETNAMGTIIESESIDNIFESIRVASDAVFALGEKRVQTILKIDDRRDKVGTIESKVASARKYSSDPVLGPVK
jgi:uncharacterized protein (TIGR00106 family)